MLLLMNGAERSLRSMYVKEASILLIVKANSEYTVGRKKNWKIIPSFSYMCNLPNLSPNRVIKNANCSVFLLLPARKLLI